MTNLAADDPAPSARPWLLGHGRAEATLLRAWQRRRLAHAWLLTGPRGVGKATLAYRFARRYLAGHDGDAGRIDHPVDEPGHPVFRMVRNRAHPDLVVFEPREARRGLTAEKVDVVRDRLEALYRTSASGRRVCLIDDAETTLSEHGESALLKILEEPPPGLVFLLVVQRAGGILPTIASRCARLRLLPLAPDLVAEGLCRLRPGLDAGTAAELAALADGSIGRALELQMLDWAGDYARLVEGLSAADDGRELRDLEAVATVAALAERGSLAAATGLMAVALRRALRTSCGRPPERPLFADELAGLERLAAGAGTHRLLSLAGELTQLSGLAQSLNLDPTQALVQIVHGIRHPDRPSLLGPA